MPDLHWYRPLEQCRTLEQIQEQWHPLLEQHHMTPAYNPPVYQDAMLSFLGNCALPAQLKLAAVLAFGSAFDFDLRLALGALFKQTFDEGVSWPLAVGAAVSDNGPAFEVPTTDAWLSAFVLGRFAGLRETFTHDGVNSEAWRTAFWNQFLVMACRHASVAAVERALHRGADALADDGEAVSVAGEAMYLYEIARSNEVCPDHMHAQYEQVLLQLLDSGPQRNAVLTAALAAAARANNVLMLDFLLRQGADVGADQGAAAAAAARNLGYEAFEWLLLHGADMRRHGQAALAAAIATLDETMVETVLAAGANLQGLADLAFRTALATQPWDLYSVEAKLPERRANLIALLLRHGARPVCPDLMPTAQQVANVESMMALAAGANRSGAHALALLRLVEQACSASSEC